MKLFANIISVVLHPLLMCTYGSLIFFFLLKGSPYDIMLTLKFKLIITAMIFSFSFMLPVVNIFILYKLKRIHSFTLQDQNERTFPYIMTSCFYFGLFYLFLDIQIPLLKTFIFGAGLSILFTALINFRYKISAHTVGIGGLLASLILITYAMRYDAVILISGLFVLSGLVATCRLYLNRHFPKQVYAGFFLGMGTQILVYIIFLTLKLI